MDLDFNKYCVLDGSPTTVLRVPRSRSKSIVNRSLENEAQGIKEDFYEISYNRFRSASCRDPVPKRHSHRSSEEVKRGSVYRSSSEVRVQRGNDSVVDRKKIEFSKESSSAFLEIVDALCCSDEDSSIRERSMASMTSVSNQNTSTFTDNLMELHSPDPKNPSSAPSDDVDSKSSQFTERESLDLDYNLRNEGMSSPTCLHSILKFEKRKEGRVFEFSVKSPEVSYAARSWKEDNALSWVYTFHRKKGSNANGWWFKENNRGSTAIGKMLVSYSLCTKPDETGAFVDSMATEFVLYDSDQSRRSLTDVVKSVSDMRPELEIAAIVTQVPFKNTECRKLGDKERRKINVVIPAGIHGFPIDDDGCRPSSLLERWRSGGSCDCGGWDMACPLDAYENSDHQQPGMLLDKGRRVAFSMRAVKDGEYAVDFHAKLSALQAFSICIAFLHSAENPSFHNDSVRVFSEEEVAHLMNAIAEEEQEEGEQEQEQAEQFRPKTSLQQAIPSLVLNPPFSPISRV